MLAGTKPQTPNTHFEDVFIEQILSVVKSAVPSTSLVQQEHSFAAATGAQGAKSLGDKKLSAVAKTQAPGTVPHLRGWIIQKCESKSVVTLCLRCLGGFQETEA